MCRVFRNALQRRRDGGLISERGRIPEKGHTPITERPKKKKKKKKTEDARSDGREAKGKKKKKKKRRGQVSKGKKAHAHICNEKKKRRREKVAQFAPLPSQRRFHRINCSFIFGVTPFVAASATTTLVSLPSYSSFSSSLLSFRCFLPITPTLLPILGINRLSLHNWR